LQFLCGLRPNFALVRLMSWRSYCCWTVRNQCQLESWKARRLILCLIRSNLFARIVRAVAANHPYNIYLKVICFWATTSWPDIWHSAIIVIAKECASMPQEGLSCASARVLDSVLKCRKSAKLQLYVIGLLATINCSIGSYQRHSALPLRKSAFRMLILTGRGHTDKDRYYT